MEQIAKRAFDIAASGAALLVLSPVLAASALGITVSDPGPVFYMANRVGQGNSRFKMFKFRSMRVDKNADEKNFKADVNRIFKWGQIMRDTKLDELPQLINVLKGDMSIVGPRPAAVDQEAITRGGKYSVVSQAKPGLTGPSALYDYIYGDSILDEAEYERLVLPTRLDLDLYYIEAMSVGYDLKMIWYTIVCIACTVTHKKPEKILEELLQAAQSVQKTE